MTELTAAAHHLLAWLTHQWWFIGGLLVLGLAASEAADRDGHR